MNPTSNPLLVRAEVARRLEEAQAHHRAVAFRSPRSRWRLRRTAVRALALRLPKAPRECAVPATAAVDPAV